MSKSRRQFLTQASLAALAAAAGCGRKPQRSGELPAGSPPPSATPPVGPEVSTSTFAEAEKLVQVELSTADSAMAARSWRTSLASVLRRTCEP